MANIVAHANDRVSSETQLRVAAYWTNVDPQLGAQVAAGLGHGDGSSDGRASTHAAEVVGARANRP